MSKHELLQLPSVKMIDVGCPSSLLPGRRFWGSAAGHLSWQGYSGKGPCCLCPPCCFLTSLGRRQGGICLSDLSLQLPSLCLCSLWFTSLLFLQYSRLTPTPGPLHLLFPHNFLLYISRFLVLVRLYLTVHLKLELSSPKTSFSFTALFVYFSFHLNSHPG